MSLAETSLEASPALISDGRVQLLWDLIRYGACSAAALALDYGLLLVLAKGLGVHYLVASGAGFLAGLALAYILSITFVFKGRRTLEPREEFAGFAAIGAAGLALTQLLLAGLVSGLGISVVLAKPMTAVAVFLFNFGMRRATLFEARPTEMQRKPA
jgi:putative flippase GtrA